MGCDIHLFVERRDEQGKWVTADTWEPEDGRMRVDYHKRFYTGRNYDLFAILADVRNGRGFAGVKTGGGFIPISPPKGLPDDVSPQVAEDSEGWGSDGHSHSWHTVKDLMEYDWTQVGHLQGFVQFRVYEEWSRWSRKQGECPDSYCGGVGGGSTKIISMEAGDKLLEQLYEVRRQSQNKPHEERAAAEKAFMDEHAWLYVESHWEQPYYKTSRHFLSDCLPKLWRLGKPEDVRIVFWFDN